MSSNETLELHIFRAFMNPGRTRSNGHHNTGRRMKPPLVVAVLSFSRFAIEGVTLDHRVVLTKLEFTRHVLLVLLRVIGMGALATLETNNLHITFAFLGHENSFDDT